MLIPLGIVTLVGAAIVALVGRLDLDIDRTTEPSRGPAVALLTAQGLALLAVSGAWVATGGRRPRIPWAVAAVALPATVWLAVATVSA